MLASLPVIVEVNRNATPHPPSWLRRRARLARRLRFRWIRSLVFFGFRLWLRKIHNPERLPLHGPVMIVSNHASYFDWAVLASVLRRRTVFLGAKELQERPIVRWLMKLNTLVYIDRDHPGVAYFREIMRQFQRKRVVVVYPEGHRSRTGKRQPIHLGFVKLAIAANVPIIPLGMKGTFEILPPHKRLPRFKRCEIFVGEPLRVSGDSPLFCDFFEPAQSPRHLSDRVLIEIGERIMDEIGKMLGPGWDNGTIERRQRMRLVVHKSQPNGIGAFFDVDRTLVRLSTQRALARFCQHKGLLPLTTYLRALQWFALSRFNLSPDSISFRESIYQQVFTRHTLAEWNQWFDECFHLFIEPKISRTVRDLVNHHKRNHHVVVLVSASLNPLIERLAALLDIPHILATRLEVINGHFSGHVEGPILQGSTKSSAIEQFARQHHVNLRESFAYADSFADARMLAKVGHPFVVHPDRKLATYAQRKAWSAIGFVR